MELKTLVFEKRGPANTDATLAIAVERALALSIKQIIVASSHGGTAKKAQALCAPHGIKAIAVSLGHSFADQGWPMTPEETQSLHELGVVTVTGIHALGDNVGTAFAAKYSGYPTAQVVRDTLYRFGQGMKVAVEDILMAAEAGVVDMNAEVVSVAGSSTGADTAIVCKPAYARTFHDLEIREVLAKPRIP